MDAPNFAWNDFLTSEIFFIIVNTVRDYNLYSNVKDLRLQLKPIANALKSIQGDSLTLVDVYPLWYSLEIMFC